jgi:hypothetical protein
MTAQDSESIRRVYRLRRLLASHEEAARSTYSIVKVIGVTEEQVLSTCDEENQRRQQILTQIHELECELSR